MTTKVRIEYIDNLTHPEWKHQIISRDHNGDEKLLAVLAPGEAHEEYLWDGKDLIIREIRG